MDEMENYADGADKETPEVTDISPSSTMVHAVC